jgi:hypothetical protein
MRGCFNQPNLGSWVQHRQRQRLDAPGAKIRVEFCFQFGPVETERVDDLIESYADAVIGGQAGENQSRTA